ncbi:MAG: GNAT family N-acetyltransferase [Anaerolineales bacterium]|nr:GNAT family N-acetyltransferase [Anaerolineales bacterium]
MSTLSPQSHTLKDDNTLHIRTAVAADAGAILDHVHAVSAESDYLNFGPGEFTLTEAQEADYLTSCETADNQLYIMGLLDGQVVSTLNFTAGRRARVRHSGEFSLSVRQAYWGLGIGGFMMDALIDWAKTHQIAKINLRVRADNGRGVALYEHKGFAIEGTLRREIVIAGEYFDHYWMGLLLD